MSTPAVFDQMPDVVREAITQRQKDNGFSDIDGLHDYIKEIWSDYDRSRATTGRISQEIKDIVREGIRYSIAGTALIESLKDNLQDLGILNTYTLEKQIKDILDDPQLQELTIYEQIEALRKIASSSSRVAGNYGKYKDERRKDKSEVAQKTTSSDENRQWLLEQMDRLLASAPQE